MTLPVSMRVDKYWDLVSCVSCGGNHIFIVHKPGTDQGDAYTQFRVLWINPGEDRWHLTAQMRKVTAVSLLVKARTALHRGESLKGFRRSCDQYTRTVIPGLLNARRKALHDRIELGKAKQNPNFGIF